MRCLRIGSGRDSATMSESGTGPRDERLYLQQQMRIARAGMGHVLTEIPRSLPRMIDPRRWIRCHPVASTAVVFGATVAAGTGINRAGLTATLARLRTSFTWLRGFGRVGSRVVRSAGRALIGTAVARMLWGSG
jgi:hypothetical protein